MGRPITPTTCVESGHRYAMVWLKRCPHLQGWHLEVTAYEDAADDTVTIFKWSTESGPFDDPTAVLDWVPAPLREALLAVLLAE